MPFLELSAGDILGTAWHQVRAAMLWPLDAEKRRAAALALSVLELRERLGLLDTANQIQVSVCDLRLLIEGAVAVPEFEREVESRQRHGTLAGAVLIDFLRAKLHNPIRKIKLDLDIFQSIGERFSISKSEIENVCWKDFRCVAHFWAAASLTTSAGARFPINLQDLTKFLAVAEELRRHGEELPMVRGNSILRPAETWKVPPHLDLPRVELKV
jgi:hypothetical protein